jgi:Thioredoxin
VHTQNLAPHYDKFATVVRGKVKVGAVDCTQQQQQCQEFGVRIFVADPCVASLCTSILCHTAVIRVTAWHTLHARCRCKGTQRSSGLEKTRTAQWTSTVAVMSHP